MHTGLTFREVFQHVGEVRSLIPPHVSILAMTATVTTTDQLYIQNLLSMQSPQMFIMSPLKKNLHYGVKECKSVEVFLELVAELKSLRTKMKRTIIFCQTIRDCTTIY